MLRTIGIATMAAALALAGCTTPGDIEEESTAPIEEHSGGTTGQTPETPTTPPLPPLTTDTDGSTSTAPMHHPDAFPANGSMQGTDSSESGVTVQPWQQGSMEGQPLTGTALPPSTGNTPPTTSLDPRTALNASKPTDNTVHFGFDSDILDAHNQATVRAHGAYLLSHPSISVRLQGHTDERGTREYNLALGERRARTVADLLQIQGVSADRIEVVSFGKEKPLDSEHNEYAWAKNRRVEFHYPASH